MKQTKLLKIEHLAIEVKVANFIIVNDCLHALLLCWLLFRLLVVNHVPLLREIERHHQVISIIRKLR